MIRSAPMSQRTIFVLVLATLFWTAASAAETSSFPCGVPTDREGIAIPTPEGNLGYVSVPGGVCGGRTDFTWDYLGTVVDDDGTAYSIQATLVQFTRGDHRSEGPGFGIKYLDFAFADRGVHFYVNSAYGGREQSLEVLAQTLATVRSSADLTEFNITAEDVLEAKETRWTVRTDPDYEPAHEHEIYRGYVGQPGHAYRLEGTGVAHLWRYDGEGGKTPYPYEYRFEIHVVDERGFVTEGLANGYVGRAVAGDRSLPSHYKTEYEIAQARLRVQEWSLSLQSRGEDRPGGFRDSYSFDGREGMMWADLGPIKVAGATRQAVRAAAPSKHLEGSVKPSLLKALKAFEAAGEQNGGDHNPQAKALYHGNWLPVQFTRGEYRGATVAFSVFWTGECNPQGQSSDEFKCSKMGWANLFTGILPSSGGSTGSVTSSYSLTESMVPGVPEILDAGDPRLEKWKNPFEVRFVDLVDKRRYPVAYPWVKELTITIRAHSTVRHALAAYANQQPGRLWYKPQDDPGSDLVLTLEAFSPVTENQILGGEILPPVFEGAARVTLGGEDVGYSWIEHMAPISNSGS